MEENDFFGDEPVDPPDCIDDLLDWLDGLAEAEEYHR